MRRLRRAIWWDAARCFNIDETAERFQARRIELLLFQSRENAGQQIEIVRGLFHRGDDADDLRPHPKPEYNLDRANQDQGQPRVGIGEIGCQPPEQRACARQR